MKILGIVLTVLFYSLAICDAKKKFGGSKGGEVAVEYGSAPCGCVEHREYIEVPVVPVCHEVPAPIPEPVPVPVPCPHKEVVHQSHEKCSCHRSCTCHEVPAPKPVPIPKPVPAPKPVPCVHKEHVHVDHGCGCYGGEVSVASKKVETSVPYASIIDLFGKKGKKGGSSHGIQKTAVKYSVPVQPAHSHKVHVVPAVQCDHHHHHHHHEGGHHAVSYQKQVVSSADYAAVPMGPSISYGKHIAAADCDTVPMVSSVSYQKHVMPAPAPVAPAVAYEKYVVQPEYAPVPVAPSISYQQHIDHSNFEVVPMAPAVSYHKRVEADCDTIPVVPSVSYEKHIALANIEPVPTFVAPSYSEMPRPVVVAAAPQPVTMHKQFNLHAGKKHYSAHHHGHHGGQFVVVSHAQPQATYSHVPAYDC